MATTTPEKAKKKAKKVKLSPKPEKLTAHIILDRSCSMASNWGATIAGVNAYVENLAKSGVQGTVSLTVFDTAPEFALSTLPRWAGGNAFQSEPKPCIETLRTNIEIDDWTTVSPSEVTPRGSTPLRDAVGRTLHKMRNQGIEGKVAVVVMTDGYENASIQYSVDEVAKIIKACEADGWLITYLGANHDAWSQAKDLGFRAATVANYAEASVAEAFTSTSAITRNYTSGIVTLSSAGYSDEDRKRMMGK